MAIRRSRYYNNPQIGQAFDNLAGIFAPPSGADLAGYATAAAKKAEAERLAEFYRRATDPSTPRETVDRYGVGSGAFGPNASYYAVDSSNATTRRGQDVTAETIRRNADLDARTKLEMARLEQAGQTQRNLEAPVAAGATRFVTPGSQTTYGLPAQQVGAIELKPGEVTITPDGRRLEGRVQPLTTDQWQAQQADDLRGRGLIPDQVLVDTIVGKQTPVQAIDPTTNRPAFMAPGTAVRLGAQPAQATAAAPKAFVGLLPDGTQVPAVQRQDGALYHAQTGEKLPDNVKPFNVPTPQGANEAVGLGTTNENRVDQDLLSIAEARTGAKRALALIQASPASQGVVGALRGTVQDVIQTGGELGQFFGGDIARLADEARSKAKDAGLSKMFDPSIPAIEAVGNMLAYQVAKAQKGDRLSSEDVAQTKNQLGLHGLGANQANAEAKISELLRSLDERENMLWRARSGGVAAVRSASGAGAPNAPPPGAAPKVMRFDANGNMIR